MPNGSENEVTINLVTFLLASTPPAIILTIRQLSKQWESNTQLASTLFMYLHANQL